jgi:pSer/pThr/pTyr-binding forkhead associated (FHA) protein
MSLQAKTILNLIAGAVAGLLAWMLTDLTGWFPFLKIQEVVKADSPLFLLYGALFGLMLGLMLGIVDALSLDSQRQMWTTLLWGSVIGFFGGAIGIWAGQNVYALLAPHGVAVDEGSPVVFFQRLFARAIGYAFVGAIVGAAQGASRRSVIIARQGAFGGFVGGVIGGMVFQIIATVLNQFPNVAVLSRLAALAATGALVGFFVGLVQNLFKQAWVRVVLGRNEGKEYLLAKPITTIGRSELSDIGLYGDPQTHAVIESIPAQKRHRLRHVADAPGQGRGGPYPPTFINGQPVTAEQWLADGDTVQLGKRTLLFQEKATRGVAPINPRSANSEAAIRPPDPNFGGVGLSSLAPPELGTGGAFAPTQMPSFMPPQPTMGMSSEATVVMSQVNPSSSGGVGTRLVCTLGPYAGQSFPLSHAALTLGRAPDCDIALVADTLISRRQAEFSYQDGRHQMRDLGSSNGTFVNGRRIDGSYTLSSGDLAQMGDTTLRYE